MQHEDTIAALATPSGESAIAVIRVAGPQAASLAISALALRRSPTPRRASYGAWRSLAGVELDGIVYCFFQGPRSYTGDDVLEISCHGNPLVATRLLEDLLARGCRQADPGEFTKRAFLNGRMDLTQAEAVMELIQARSDRALRVANNQLRGTFGRQLAELKASLLQTVAMVEAYIDFPEEDLPPERRDEEIDRIQKIIAFADRIIDSGESARFLREGIKTLILGEPNAGKSSLLNRMLGFERAIVSEEPGTTRDFLREAVYLDGYCIQLMDTAGLRESRSDIERQGIRKTIELVDEADLFLLVVDATAPSPDLPAAVAKRLTADNCILVYNKVDLENRRPPSPALAGYIQVAFSAKTGAGLSELRTRISGLIQSRFARDQDDLILVNTRHQSALRELGARLRAAVEGFESSAPPEIVASELRGAVDAIGLVLGRIDSEEVLDALFSSFCIGK